MGLVASPTSEDLVADRDQDLTIEVTLPAGPYLTGGAAAWGLQFVVTYPGTDAVVINKTTGGGGIVVTAPGSASVAAVFTVTIIDTDILTVSRVVVYEWKFKRSDDGSEVNIAAGTITFKR